MMGVLTMECGLKMSSWVQFRMLSRYREHFATCEVAACAEIVIAVGVQYSVNLHTDAADNRWRETMSASSVWKYWKNPLECF